MTTFNITHLAGYVCFDDFNAPVQHKEVAIERIVQTAVDFLNDPIKGQARLEELVSIYELDFGLGHMDERIELVIRTIQQDVRKLGSDPRLKFKLEYVKHGRDRLLNVVMDLDATAKAITSSERKQKAKERKKPYTGKVTDVVSDAPTPELMNELCRVVAPRPKSRAPVLSDRFAQRVIDAKDRSW